eukprot:m.26996 g.26996  ORF g.26996 m.26996 type:complete len:448 (+) comp29636_c0_seq3:177-1520(+)
MSRRTRSSAHAPENVTMTLNERILKDCHSFYVDEERGLVSIAKQLELTLFAPKKKINVLLIGNHSAGKSSFINWYVEEHVQRTGVAMETQGFTFVTSGKKRESLTGNATLHLYPHFDELRKQQGVVEYLTTEISTSKQKKFSLVTFVDTPGLVDGDMIYPFDVDKAILWLGDLADIIFVFFDPIGQALCKRTLTLVEKLNSKHPDRIRFYLSKADTAGTESDRQRVLMQIVQELCKRPGLNKAAFDMPTIFIPTLTGKSAKCENQLEETAKEISKTIDQMIQTTLNSLENDCQSIATLALEKLDKDQKDQIYNIKARLRGFFVYSLALIFPVMLLLSLLTTSSGLSVMEMIFGEKAEAVAASIVDSITWLFGLVPENQRISFLIMELLLCLLLWLLGRYVSRTRTTLSKRSKRSLNDMCEYVQDIGKKKKALYREYLEQSVGSEFVN